FRVLILSLSAFPNLLRSVRTSSQGFRSETEPASIQRGAQSAAMPQHAAKMNAVSFDDEKKPLLANGKPLNDVDVALRFDLLQIVQQAATSAHLGQQTTPAGIVLLMRSHVLGECIDSRGENRNLNFRRTGV